MIQILTYQDYRTNQYVQDVALNLAAKNIVV